MIVITGATGKLGSRIVRQLLQLRPADEVGVSVRDVDAADELVGRGVRGRRGDFAEPASLATAFEGATQVLIVSSSVTGDESLGLHRAAIDAAHRAGVERVVYTSHQAANAGSQFAPMRDHASTEQHLQQIGLPYTSLRNGFYASTVPMLLGQAFETGEIRAPADGPVSWTAHADLAEAAAAILADPGRFDGATPPLTGARALDLADIAEELSTITGRTIRRVVIDDDEWAAQLVDHGLPAASAEMLVGMFRASRAGEFAVTDPALEDLLGHPPTDLQSTLGHLGDTNLRERTR